MKKKINSYLTDKNIRFLNNSEIGEFLTMRVGGEVGFIVFTNSNDQLTGLLKILFDLKQKYILIGGGSNIVFPDSCNELIVIINSSSEIIIEEKNILKLNTGLKNTDFLEYCKKNNIAGFEFLAGIPGTLGGATAVNAGAFGRSISDKIIGGDIFTEDGIFEYRNKEFFRFVYRNSRFKYGKDVIINIYLKFEEGESNSIKDRINEIVKLRTDKHPPYSSFTAGCFFKNPEVDGKKISAGKLIEECNLKGYEKDEVMISDKHSNFLVNKGAAVFSDIEELGIKIQKTVKEKNGISLEREVIFVSPDGDKF